MRCRRRRAILRGLALAALLQGCAGNPVRDESTDANVELAHTPFFPQSKYHCGPAALATVLRYSGVRTTPAELIGDVYVPAKKGSFQVELLAAARRHGRLAYVIAPRLSAIVAELLAGRPVLVMQNLALARLPVWHYAVVVGVDSEAGAVLLRSGTTERLAIPVAEFLRSWNLAANWAFVALRPDEVPAEPERRRLLQAIVDLQASADHALSAKAFAGFLQLWPQDPVALLGLGNAYLALARPEQAIRVYQQLLTVQPRYVPARNNLALAYARLHCMEAARQQLQLALSSDGADVYARALHDTARTIAQHTDVTPHPLCRP